MVNEKNICPTVPRVVVIIAAIVLIIFLIFGLLIGLGYYCYARRLRAPIEPIEQQLKALNEGDLKGAYGNYTSGAFKARTTFQQFNDLVANNPQIFKSKGSNFDRVEIRSDQAEVSGTITGQNGTVTPVTYNLVFEKERWRILGFRQGADFSE